MAVYLKSCEPSRRHTVEDLKALPPDRLEMAAGGSRRRARWNGKRLSPARSDASRRKKPTKWKESSRKAASKSMNMAGSVLVDTNAVAAYFRGDKVLHPHFAGITPVYLPWWCWVNFTSAPEGHSGGRNNSPGFASPFRTTTSGLRRWPCSMTCPATRDAKLHSCVAIENASRCCLPARKRTRSGPRIARKGPLKQHR
jgi:hypothetical protein